MKSAVYPDTMADKGIHKFTYSLYPHIGNVTEGGTIEAANQLNLPAQVVSGVFTDRRKIVEVSSDCMQIDAVKRAEDEDCLIVRLHECRGGSRKVTLTSQFGVKRIMPCNLLEHDSGEMVEGSKVSFEVTPFMIKTFKLYL